jgi:predicted ATP-dependent serine protease
LNKETEIFQKVKTGDIVVPIKDACEHNGEYAESYNIGFKVFDEAMKAHDKDNGGVRNGDLVVITGISGMGKTTFMQNIALNLNKINIPSVFFSYEVLIDHLYAKFKLMGFNDDNVIYAPKKIITGNLNWIKEKVQEAKEKYYAKAIFIDHIDFLSPANKTNSDQLRMMLRNITQELKTIALEEEIIIFLVAHTKKVEGREVEMQDVAESSGIYQLADYVFSVARGVDEVQDGNKIIKIFTDEGIIKLLKNRLTGDLPYLKFEMDNNIIKGVFNV